MGRCIPDPPRSSHLQSDKASAQSRISAQMPLEEKIARSDIVLDNSGSREQLETKVRNELPPCRDVRATAASLQLRM